jgi:KipI family sensor histidine kinase inhibitor
MTARVLDAGDAAFTVEFGDRVDPALLGAVNALDSAVAREQAAGRLPGLIETMPTFRSLTLFFDPLLTSRAALLQVLEPLFGGDAKVPALAGRLWRLPACYDEQAGPDLAAVARTIGSTVEEVVALHSGTEVLVYMLGFLPGFPFMGDLPQRLRLPRLTEPRLRVPGGSVAIADGLTAIYPWESPGGWHLLARCPVPLFDAHRDSPSLLAPGDRVRFHPVPMVEFRRLEAALKAGEIDPAHFLVEGVR